MIYIAICIALLLVAVVLTWANEKYKTVSRVLAFISAFSMLTAMVNFSLGFDPVLKIREWIISNVSSLIQKTSDDAIPSASPLPPPFEVRIPQSGDKSEVASTPPALNATPKPYSVKTVLLNVEDRMYRDENNKIYFLWVPIAGQEKYRVKIQIDDPFAGVETDIEVSETGNRAEVDVSAYDYETVMFVSVGVWDDVASEWLYTDPLSFTFY